MAYIRFRHCKGYGGADSVETLSLVISGSMSSLENLHRFIALGSGIGVPDMGQGS